MRETEGIPSENRAVLRRDREAIEALDKGKFVLVCDGKFIGAFDTEDQAIEASRGYRICVIDSRSYSPIRGEWGWGSIASE